MTTINQLLKEKGPAYFSVHPDETVYSAIKKMGEKGIRCTARHGSGNARRHLDRT